MCTTSIERAINEIGISHHSAFNFYEIHSQFRVNKFGAGGGGGDDTTSRDSDSLIQEYINMPPTETYPHCWNHPKIRENWRTVLAAVLLLVIGIVLVTMGIFAIANPANGSQGFVFLLAGTFVLFDYRSIIFVANRSIE